MSARLILFLVMPSIVLAADPLFPPAALPKIIQQAVERNPGLKAARSRWEAALQKFPQARSLPDPMVEYQYSAMDASQRLGLSQVLPPPTMVKAEMNMALVEAQMARLQYDIALRDLIVETKIVYNELVYLDRARTLTEQNRELLRHILQVTSARFAQQKATLNDLLKARAQDAQLEYDLVLLRELQDVERVRLATFLNLPSDTVFQNPIAPELTQVPLTPEQVEELALTRRQELRLMQAEVKNAGFSVDLAESKWWPEFKIMVTTQVDEGDGMKVDDEDSWMGEISMSVPFNFLAKRAAVKEARARREAAGQDLVAMTDETRAMVRKAFFNLRNALRLLQLYDQSLLPQARQAIETAETWNVDKDANLPGLLEVQSTWLNFNLARLRAVTDYQQNLARLERLAGGRLTREESP